MNNADRSDIGRVYEFVFRGNLAETALDVSGRPSRHGIEAERASLAEAVNLDMFEDDYLQPALQMAVVYSSIAAFENAVRAFITKVLVDAHGEDWWDAAVSDKIRKFAGDRRAEEEKTKWHGLRGDDLLSYTELGQLVNVMQQNWTDFEPYVRRIDWATSIFSSVER